MGFFWRFSRIAACVLFFGVTIYLAPTEVAAQGVGIKVTPAFIEELAEPGEVLEETLVIMNVNDEAKTFFLYRQDISGVEADGVPVFAEEGVEPTGYELSEWIIFDEQQIEVPANGEFRLPIRIEVPENASPGSHFGGIFVSAEPPRLREIGAGVGYEVASIMSIRISGDITDNARIRSFSTNKLFFGSKDIDFLIKVENQGNILIQPRGPLTITNMFDGITGNVVVNDTLAGVFPGTVRDFNVHWEDEEPGFGRYEAIVALNYNGEGGNKTIDASVTFWIFPIGILIPVVIVLLVLIGGGYLLTRLYVTRVIAQTQGSRRIVSRRYRRRAGVSRFVFVLMTLLTVTAFFLIILLVLFG